MSASVTYAVANDDDDELLTFAARGDAMMADTSAGVDVGEDPGDDLDAITAASYAGKAKTHRRCLWIVIPVLLLAAVGAVVGIITQTKGERGTSNATSGTPENSTATGPRTQSPSAAVPTYTVKVLKRTPHDRNAFTQGFEYARGSFFESTGVWNKSTVRKVRIRDGKVMQLYRFKDPSLFGEGLTLHKDHHIFVLTWKAGRGFILDQKTFKLVKEWKYKGEGWGLTMDDEKNEVYMSDGTTELRVLEPENLTEKRRIKVTLNGKPVVHLNEIEWVCGEVWANVWQTKLIYRINPVNGVVTSIIDASNLPLPQDIPTSQDVLNGIAYDKMKGRLWLTGKLWSAVYQVSVSDKSLNLKTCKQSP